MVHFVWGSQTVLQSLGCFAIFLNAWESCEEKMEANILRGIYQFWLQYFRLFGGRFLFVCWGCFLYTKWSWGLVTLLCCRISRRPRQVPNSTCFGPVCTACAALRLVVRMCWVLNHLNGISEQLRLLHKQMNKKFVIASRWYPGVLSHLWLRFLEGEGWELIKPTASWKHIGLPW